MCIAVPGQIISMDNEKKTARVSISGNEMDINIRLITPSLGDYVLIHAGCAIEIVKEEMAKEIEELFYLLQEAAEER